MTKTFSALLGLAFLVGLAGQVTHAQNIQFLPEVDAYLKLNSMVRVYAQAKEDRDAGDPAQSSVGPSVQFYLKPLLRLKRITAFDLDDAKSRALVLETGYRAIVAPGATPEDRWELITTSNFPLKADFLISDRNRADLDWQKGAFTWRYRNKLTLERTFAIRSYHLIPDAPLNPIT